MKERGILFKAEMVRAIIAGTKAQTRRAVKKVFTAPHGDGGAVGDCIKDLDGLPSRLDLAPVNWELCPYGVPGDRIYVKETWAIRDCGARVSVKNVEHWEGKRWPVERLQYVATDRAPGTHSKTGEPHWWNKRSAMFMPRWASRITLEITEVRVQRLAEITEADALAEGIVGCRIPADEYGPVRIGYMVGPDDGKGLLDVSPVDSYRKLWESIHGSDSWTASPWIWAISFRRMP